MMELSCLNYSTRYEDSENVAEANARVPDAEPETLLWFSKPSGNDGHDAGPSRGLKKACAELKFISEHKLLLDWTFSFLNFMLISLY